MEIKRRLNLLELLKKKSFFLLGPRSTGKSTLIQQQLEGQSLVIDLLESNHFLRLSSNPQELEQMADETDKSFVVIDEIQKIPSLLDEIHRLIEKKKIRFLLTGSSARKLKGPHVNLLAGRAWIAHLFPLTWSEIEDFDLDRYLHFGGLPQVYLSQDPLEELRAYTKTYLIEEIRSEALVRKFPAFSRFLEVASLSNGQLLNFSEIANDAQLAPSTVREYYSLLEDTLIGFLLPPWTKSKKRKAIQTAKFYLFDIGVAHALSNITHLDRHSDLYGNAFEHFIGMELRAYLGYSRGADEMRFWRSVNKQEVDYIIGDHTAIEVKSTQKISAKHLVGLKALQEEKICKNYYLVSQDAVSANREGIHCLPWSIFLKELWSGKVIG